MSLFQSSRNYRKQTLDIAKSRVKGNLMSMTMATGNLLMMMKQEDDSDDNEGGNGIVHFTLISFLSIDYGRIDAAITTIGYNTDKLMDNVRQIYEMTFDTDDEENRSGDLIEAARNLLNAFQDLLNASRPTHTEVSFNCFLIKNILLQSRL